MHPGWADTPGVEASLPDVPQDHRPGSAHPDQGADTLVWLLWADEPAQTSGNLWLDRRQRSTVHLPGTATTDEERRRLWAWVETAPAPREESPIGPSEFGAGGRWRGGE